MKKLFFSILLLLISRFVIAQSANQQQFSGVILKKGWTKTAQSYCAGGSDYYVLKTDSEEEIVLEYKTEKQAEQFFKKWIGKKVSITANKAQKKIKNEDPIAQKPVSLSPDGNAKDTEYTCWVLKVKKIKGL
jgi:hypothetical protein